MFQTLSHSLKTLAIFLSLLAMLFSSGIFAKSWLGRDENKMISSCFITDRSGAVLMVKDKFTGKFHLPGGPVENATEEETALHYVVLDTGFNVHVGNKIDQLVNHSIYACVFLAPKEFFVTENNDKVVLGWFNLFASKDVSQPYLLPNDEYLEKNYANPDEIKHFADWIRRAVPSRFVLMESGIQMLPHYYQLEHKVLIKFKKLALDFKPIAQSISLFPSMSFYLFSFLFIISMPYFRTFYGFRPVLIFGAGLVYFGLLTLILNKYFPIPPPFYVDHSFTPTQTFLYSFPAIEVTFSTFIFSYLIISWPRKRYIKDKMWFGCIGALLVGFGFLKTVIYGESYFSTILLSILVALAYSFILRYMRDLRLSDRKRALVTLRFWVFTTLLSVIVAQFSDTVRDDFIAAFTLSMTISMLLLKAMPRFTTTIRSEYRLKYFLTNIIGLVFILYFSADYFANSFTSTNLLSAKASLIPVWVMLIHPIIFRALFIKRKVASYYR